MPGIPQVLSRGAELLRRLRGRRRGRRRRGGLSGELRRRRLQRPDGARRRDRRTRRQPARMTGVPKRSRTTDPHHGIERALIGSTRAASACCSASIASGALPFVDAVQSAAARTARLFPDGLSKSMTMVFRSLRIRCATGCASAIRTRDASAPLEPSEPLRSTRTRSGSCCRPPPSWRRLGDHVAEIEHDGERIGGRRDVRDRLVASITSDAPFDYRARELIVSAHPPADRRRRAPTHSRGRRPRPR